MLDELTFKTWLDTHKTWATRARSSPVLAYLALRVTLCQLPNMPTFLNWLLRVVESLVALALAGLTIYGAYYLVFLPESHRATIVRKTLNFLNDNWKVLLLLAVPLFYRTIRGFLERVEHAFGMDAPSQSGKSEMVNPPRKPKPQRKR